MWTRLKALFLRSINTCSHFLQQQFYAYNFENKAHHISTLENLSH